VILKKMRKRGGGRILGGKKGGRPRLAQKTPPTHGKRQNADMSIMRAQNKGRKRGQATALTTRQKRRVSSLVTGKCHTSRVNRALHNWGNEKPKTRGTVNGWGKSHADLGAPANLKKKNDQRRLPFPKPPNKKGTLKKAQGDAVGGEE